MRQLVVSSLVLLLAAQAHASPGTPEEVLGDAWRQASPPDRLVLLSLAQADKQLDYRAVGPAVEEVVRGVVKAGETPEARLRLLGDLRKTAEEALKVKNEERRKAKAQTASFADASSHTQQALALDYVAAAAGPAPTLEALGCLKLVREATAWSAHHELVLSFLAEALNRDAKYREANLEGKLTIIRDMAVDRAMLGDQERKYLEEPLVCDFASGRLRAGDAPAAISQAVKAMREKGLVCFFTQSFADSMLKRLDELRAGK